jgi:hypothetical protein
MISFPAPVPPDPVPPGGPGFDADRLARWTCPRWVCRKGAVSVIKELTDLPPGVIGFEVTGKLQAEDYRDVVLPALERAAAGGEVSTSRSPSGTRRSPGPRPDPRL